MAGIVESGGLDYHFVEEPPDSLVCPVCLLPCREPHLISCCGKKTCHSCISRVQLAGQPCPLCRTPEFSTMIDREIERQVLSLKVYCNNKEDGCTWIGELRQLERHSNVCLHVCLSCKYKCGLRCPRQQMLIHERDECELRPEIVLTKKVDELTKRVTDLESTCKNQSLVIERQQAIIAVTKVGPQKLDKEKADNKLLAAKENETNVEIPSNKVAFISVPGTYKPGESIQIHYQLFPGLTTHNRDWIGLFKVGWTSNRDYYTFEWAPYKSQEEEDEDAECIRIVKFSGSWLPPDDGNFYQLCYITYSGVVKGASREFQFSNFARNASHDELEVNKKDGLLLLRTRHETEVTELQKKVQLLTQSNQNVEASFIQVKSSRDQLQSELDRINSLYQLSQTEIAQLKETLGANEAEFTQVKGNLQHPVESLQQEVTTLRSAIEAKQHEIQLTKNMKDAMKQELDDVTARVQQLLLDQGHKENEIYALRELVDKLDAELKQFQMKHDERIAEKNLAIENLQESLETKETALNDLKHQETAMKRSVEALNDENGQLKRQIYNLQWYLRYYASPQQGQPPPYNPFYLSPPQRRKTPSQRSQQSDTTTRQCPVCNLTYPTTKSQQEFEHHVNSHFQ